MTSEPAAVYVWAYLPGDIAPTVCGLFNYVPTAGGLPVGRFAYGKSYLANPDALAIDPAALPLTPRTYSTTALRGVFGALQDAMPDDWGRYVIDRTRGEVTFPLGYMLNTLDDAVGNLAFSASPTEAPPHTEVIGVELLPQARAIILGLEQGRPTPPELEGKIRPNTAMGGARPKLTVAHEGSLWLAKFPSEKDDKNLSYAKVEAAMLDLAGRCGIDAAQAKVLHDDVLLVKRFDRAWVKGPTPGWRRDSFLSARTVFHSNPAVGAYVYSGSYPRLAKELTRYSAAPRADQEQLFRRMVFNVFISNTDDHDRNHGLLADDLPGTYRLSPAYDLVPRVPTTQVRYQAMTLGAFGSLASKENLLSDCSFFGLALEKAAQIVDAVQTLVAEHWQSCLHDQGLSSPAIGRLKPCFMGIA